jgi:hypothetical protein
MISKHFARYYILNHAVVNKPFTRSQIRNVADQPSHSMPFIRDSIANLLAVCHSNCLLENDMFLSTAIISIIIIGITGKPPGG